MIQVIVGEKGTGKTKRLIEMANNALGETKGDIVFIDGDNRRMVELNHQIRFINANEFEVDDLKAFYGFVCGIISEDYDIDRIYIDGLLELLHGDLDSIEDFLSNIKKLSDKFNIKFFITMSGDPERIPAFLKEYVA